MSNSPLVNCTLLTHKHSGTRTHEVDRITPHCFVGQVTAMRGMEILNEGERKASCNYVIGKDGSVGLCVNEDCRSWCSSSGANDQRAITIECASDLTEPYAFNDAVYNKLIELSVDICKRYNKKKLLWIEDKEKALSYEPKEDEMLITVHRWFDDMRSCPGDWFYGKLKEFAETVTKCLTNEVQDIEIETDNKSENNVLYRVQVGAFKNKAYAQAMEQKLIEKGYPTLLRLIGGLYKVQTGAFRNKDNAINYQKKIIADGFDCFISSSTGD